MTNTFSQLLRTLAKRSLKKHTPHIIGVTGSVGKTTTCRAIASALQARYRVRSPQKNYNNEIGLPLAILGEKSPGRNAWDWAKIFIRHVNPRDMPEYLVLEYGADAPGDIAYLCDIAQPEVAVITAVSPVHLANFPHYEALQNEKASLGDRVREGGVVIVNADIPETKNMIGRFVARTISYGKEQNADIFAEDVAFFTKKDADGLFTPHESFSRITATIVTPNERVPITLMNCISPVEISAVLAGIAVAQFYGISCEEAVRSIEKHYTPLPGRLHILPGIRGSLILDDSYNAAPASMQTALTVLSSFTPGETRDRHIAILGDMKELGTRTKEEHQAVGRRVAEVADLFLAVGPDMRIAAEAAIASGMNKDAVEYFATSSEAGRYADKHIQGGDVVLVKGSQSMRMEHVVKDIMAEPLRAEELLVRQESAWQNRT